MSEERRDPRQAEAFRALARSIADRQSEQRFEEALRRLMAPTLDQPDLDRIEASGHRREQSSKA